MLRKILQVARYTGPPLGCILVEVTGLCGLVNHPSSSREAWIVMKNILLSDLSLPAFNHLIDALTSPDTPPALAEDDPDHRRNLIGMEARGAVFFVSMASWGSSRLDSLPYSRQFIVETLRRCVENRSERIISLEVLLSIKRLVAKFGATLRAEWGPIFAILHHMCDSLNPQPPLPSPDPKHLAASAAQATSSGAGPRSESFPASAGSEEAKESSKASAHQTVPTAPTPAAGLQAGSPGGGQGATSEELAVLEEVVGLVKNLHADGTFHGRESDLWRLVKIARWVVGKDLILHSLKHYTQFIHPSHTTWLSEMSSLMHSFFRGESHTEVRVETLKQVSMVLDDYGMMHEQELMEVVILPFFKDLHEERDSKVWEQQLDVLVGQAMRMQGDGFQSLLLLLKDAATRGCSPELRLDAARSLVRLLPATMNHLPTSRFSALWDLLLALVDTELASSAMCKEILSLITYMQITSTYRPRLLAPEWHGKELDVTCPFPISGSSQAAEASDEAKEGISSALRGKFTELDTKALFQLLCRLVEQESNQDIFEVAAEGLVRGLQNRTIFENEDVPELASMLQRKLSTGTWGPIKHGEAIRTSSVDSFNQNYELGYQILGLIIGGWTYKLSDSELQSGIRCLANGLFTTDNSPAEEDISSQAENASDSMKSPRSRGVDGAYTGPESGADSQPAAQSGRSRPFAKAGAVTSTCLNNLSLVGTILPHFILLHLPRVLDILDSCSRKEESQLVTHGMQYLKFIAIQIPKVPGGVPVALQERALSVALQFMDQKKWGALIANLTNRSVNLWYLNSDLSVRARFLSKIASPFLLHESRKSDPLCAIMLDWLMRNATNDMRANSQQAYDRIEKVFRHRDVKSKTFAVNDCIVSIRCTPQGLIDLTSRRPTDMKRWIFFMPQAGRVGQLFSPVADALVQLLTSTIQIQDVSSVNTRFGDDDIDEGGAEVQEAPARPRESRAKRDMIEPASDGIEPGADLDQMAEAVDPEVVLMQFLRGPFGNTVEAVESPLELKHSDPLFRGIRMLDQIPLTFTHKFGVIYIAHDQRTEDEFLSNTGGSASYEAFLRRLGDYMPLADCGDDVYTGGLDRSQNKKDGEIALFWRNSLAQCIFFAGTLMPNEPGEQQVNKKRFIGNTFVKVVYTDSDHWFSLATLSGQFNLFVIVVAPLTQGYYRLTVLKDPAVPSIGPIKDVTLVPEHAVSTVVRRILIDGDVATMIGATGELKYTTNWEERLKQLRQMRSRHSCEPSQASS